jgi:ubiquinone/menaquinone biosynthesis C-methylase UbiE
VTSPAPVRTQQVATLFDQVADSYDDVGVPFFRLIAADLLAAMPPQPGERWLDVGCGRGAVLLQVAEAVRPEVAVGTDLSPGMLERCRQEAARAGLDVRLVVDDAQNPAVRGGPFDTLSSSLVLFFLPDPAAAVRAWMTLVAPGGRIGTTTFGPGDERWAEIDELFTPYLPPHLLDARTTGASGPFASDDAMEELLRGAGWTQVRTVRGQVPVRFPTPGHWRAFSMATGQRGMWMSVPEPERDGVRERAYALLARFADADGSVTFQQRIRHTLARRPDAETGRG